MTGPMRKQRARPPGPSEGWSLVSRPLVAVSRRRAVDSPAVLELAVARLRIVTELRRVQIMVLLDRRGPATVGEVTDWLPSCAYANVSRHLRLLAGAGIVVGRRSGKYVRYELADRRALWLIEQVFMLVRDDQRNPP